MGSILSSVVADTFMETIEEVGSWNILIINIISKNFRPILEVVVSQLPKGHLGYSVYRKFTNMESYIHVQLIFILTRNNS